MRITNCKQPCLHFRMNLPSNEIGGKQHVIRQQLGFRNRPLKFRTIAPGPPTHSKHSDRKLYMTQASYRNHKYDAHNVSLVGRFRVVQEVPIYVEDCQPNGTSSARQCNKYVVYRPHFFKKAINQLRYHTCLHKTFTECQKLVTFTALAFSLS